MMTSTDSNSEPWVELHFTLQDANDLQNQNQGLASTAEHGQDLQPSSSHHQRAIEQLLREAQRSGLSSISQSGNVSPVYGDCRSPPVLVEDQQSSYCISSKATAELMQNNTDWLWDWSGQSFASAGRSKRGSHRSGKQSASSSVGSLSLRKTGLMRRQPAPSTSSVVIGAGGASSTMSSADSWHSWAWYYCCYLLGDYQSPVVSAVTHAVCFIVGAATVFVVMRSSSKPRSILGH